MTMLLLPGWALLSLGQYWKRWQPLQRWFLALSLGIAVYPVMFYLARAIVPSLHIGLNKLIVFLIICALIVAWRYQHDWKDQFKLGKHAPWVIVVLVVTMATRLILAHQYPYPAWTDSLHHSIITKLVMINGQLPYTMLPYDPGGLSVYHLGLYSLTGSAGLLAGIAPHSALLWFCQVINGFAAIGVFLVLDKLVSRTAAIAGLVFAGLMSFQPAWYFNWGWDTQLVGQTLLLPAALVFWDFLQSIVKPSREKPSHGLSAIFIVAILLAGCALVHWRVAAFLLPVIILLALLALFNRGLNTPERKKIVGAILITGLVSFVMILPAFLPAINDYLSPPLANNTNFELPATPRKLSEDPYFRFSWKTFYVLGVNKELSIIALFGLIVGLISPKTRSFSLVLLFWLIVLVIEGYLYIFNIRKLAFINMTGVMIVGYLPGALGFGLLVENVNIAFGKVFGSVSENVAVAALLFIGVVFAPDRVKGVESYRHYMTPQDEAAMAWMKSNLAKDAVIGINTEYWTKTEFVGTDAGFWIPYYAELETSTRTMASGRSSDYYLVRMRTDLIIDLYSDPGLLPDLCGQGVDYLYSANKPPYNRQDFDFEALSLHTGTSLVYDRDGVQILEICR
ncbi:MAG: hypothetical protein WBI14_05300 [Anaerolineaceae bacterium]